MIKKMLSYIFIVLITILWTGRIDTVDMIRDPFLLEPDGTTIIGYPFIFYDYSSVKCYDCYGMNFFKPELLFLDILIIIIVLELIIYIISFLKKALYKYWTAKYFNE